MIQNVIAKMIEKGWSLDVISLETGISVEKLKHHGELTERQEDAVMRLASVGASIDIDECFGGEE